jgi:hypothetical protein
MAIAIIPGSTAGMVFYPGGHRATGWRLPRLLAWAATGIPPHGRHRRPESPEPAREAGPQSEQDVTPGADINMFDVYARNDHARRMVAGFAAEMPSLSRLWQQVDRALADVPTLGMACARLTAELSGVRIDRARLVAAMRAALTAHVQGDDDPLSYLRDELARQQALPELSGGDHDDA